MEEESGGKKVERFYVRDYHIFDSLIYLEPAKRF